MEFSRRNAPHLPQPPLLRRLGRDLIIAHPTGREFPKGEGAHALSLWTLLCTPPLLAKVTPPGGSKRKNCPVPAAAKLLIIHRAKTPLPNFRQGGLFPSSHSFVTMGMIMGLRFVCLYR